MPGIVALRDALSDDVIASLAAASYPPLTDGKILLGRQYQFEQSAPPRIIFIPVRSDFPAKDVYNRSPTGGGYTAEQLAQNKNPSVLSDQITFEVRCWGVSLDQDPDIDFDFTQVLYQQVLRTCDKLARGTYVASSGDWTDAQFSSGQLVRDGREFVFKLTFGTPILLFLAPLLSAPNNVAPQITDSLILPTGASEAGCEEP